MCGSCGRKAWPPSKICPFCYSETILEKIKLSGTLVEFTISYVRNREGTFGVVDLDGIKIVGMIKTDNPNAGMQLTMVACGLLEDGTPFYDFEPTKT